jgi:Tfp pilus assembly protein PilF
MMAKENKMKNCLLFRLVIVLFVVCTSIQASAQQNNMTNEALSINELEMIVDDAEKQGNVSARSHIHQYCQLADLYLKNKDYRNAYNIIIKGLKLDSWNYKYQKIASEIEVMNQESGIWKSLYKVEFYYKQFRRIREYLQ